jgi:hypothetical protein
VKLHTSVPFLPPGYRPCLREFLHPVKPYFRSNTRHCHGKSHTPPSHGAFHSAQIPLPPSVMQTICTITKKTIRGEFPGSKGWPAITPLFAQSNGLPYSCGPVELYIVGAAVLSQADAQEFKDYFRNESFHACEWPARNDIFRCPLCGGKSKAGKETVTLTVQILLGHCSSGMAQRSTLRIICADCTQRIVSAKSKRVSVAPLSSFLREFMHILF